MTDPSRRLLVIGDASVTRHVEASLDTFHWSVERLEPSLKSLEALEPASYQVGLVIVVKKGVMPYDDIDSILGLADLDWIALVEKDLLDDDRVRRLIHRGCQAFHTFPIKPLALNTLLESVLAMAGISPRHPHLAPPQDESRDTYCMVGDSPVMQALYHSIHKVAGVDAPVLITGESGTGKELTARAIHDHSARRHGPFSVVNCGALPSGLIQSELFGHEKGAFTGANRRKTGIIEASRAGTLFLDEIGDLPLDLQVNLLRFLETLKVLRVGGVEEIPVDVRVLAATHVDLEASVTQGSFREDLYHRLNVLQVHTPALREHPEDIPPLAHFFFAKFAADKSPRLRGFAHQSLMLMRRHDWPGNIRELINRVRRAMVMCDRRLISPADLGLERRQSDCRRAGTLDQVRDQAECEAIRAAMARNDFKILHAARELGVSRVTLYRLIDKHRIDRYGAARGSSTDEPPSPPIIQLSSL
jgi:DNA-binding NtrC family response regulator